MSGRTLRRHGVSEAFNWIAGNGLPLPRYLHRHVVERCTHGHDLTDPANVYTQTRLRHGVEHLERRCRACNRQRVAQQRVRRVSWECLGVTR